MAYRRNQGISRTSTFKDEQARKKEGEVKRSYSFSNPSSLSPFATQAIHASFAHSRDADPIQKQDSVIVKDGSESESESKSGFWGILARKAKAILEEDDVYVSTRIESPVSAPAASTSPLFDSPTLTKTHHRNLSHGHDPNTNPNTTSRLSKGLRSISTSVDRPLKEGPSPVVNKATDIQHERKSPTIRGSRGAGSPRERESPTSRRNKGAYIPRERESCTPRGTKGADILHECEVRAPVANKVADNLHEREARSHKETKASDILVGRKLQIRKKGNGFDGKGPTSPGVSGTPTGNSSRQLGGMFSTQIQNHENQLKASRDVAMATAAKAKLLLRELKTVKADLAFAKERCSQLEEENKVLRCRVKGANRHNTHADDDLIRLQLETLLAEKARLANENSTYARENRFLREIVEYHQLTMQDIVYFDEYDEEEYDAEVSIHKVSKMLTVSPPSPSEDPLSIPPPEISAPSSPLEYPLSIPDPSENQILDVSTNNLVQESGDASSPSMPSSD